MIQVKNINVDIDSILSLKYKCDPSICKGECCSSYHVCITEKEIDRIIPNLHEISEFATHLKNNEEFEDIFDEHEDEISIDTNEKWQCKLLWENQSGELLCALHSLAIKNNTSYYDIKPKPCCLWPLAISKEEPYFLTVQHEDFPCLEKKEDKTLDPEVALIIKNIFGEEFLKELLLKMQRYLLK